MASRIRTDVDVPFHLSDVRNESFTDEIRGNRAVSCRVESLMKSGRVLFDSTLMAAPVFEGAVSHETPSEICAKSNQAKKMVESKQRTQSWRHNRDYWIPLDGCIRIEGSKIAQRFPQIGLQIRQRLDGYQPFRGIQQLRFWANCSWNDESDSKK